MELKIHIFTNPLNEKEWVMVPDEKIVEGYLFADYVSTGSRVLTPDNTGAMKWSKENGITAVSESVKEYYGEKNITNGQ